MKSDYQKTFEQNLDWLKFLAKQRPFEQQAKLLAAAADFESIFKDDQLFKDGCDNVAQHEILQSKIAEFKEKHPVVALNDPVFKKVFARFANIFGHNLGDDYVLVEMADATPDASPAAVKKMPRSVSPFLEGGLFEKPADQVGDGAAASAAKTNGRS